MADLQLRPKVNCPSCGMLLRLNEFETEDSRVTRHKAVGNCRPLVLGAKKPKTPTLPSVKSTLAGGWDL